MRRPELIIRPTRDGLRAYCSCGRGLGPSESLDSSLAKHAAHACESPTRVDPNCVLGTHECTGYTFDDEASRFVVCGCPCHEAVAA